MGYKCTQFDGLAPTIPHSYVAPLGRVGGRVRYILCPPAKGQLRWNDESASPPGAGDRLRRLLEWVVELAPGEEVMRVWRIPCGAVEDETAACIARLDPVKELNATRRFWRQLVKGAGQILTPDPFVNDCLVAVAGRMGQQVACRAHSGVWMYKTSPSHYEAHWPCNAAKALPTFDLRGLTRLSRSESSREESTRRNVRRPINDCHSPLPPSDRTWGFLPSGSRKSHLFRSAFTDEPIPTAPSARAG